MKLTCDMHNTCTKSVTHIDSNGFVYCPEHAKQRGFDRPCRELDATELEQLRANKPLRTFRPTRLHTITLDLPAHWASVLINGDSSGLEQHECDQIALCLDREEVGNCIGVTEESFYARTHDASQEGVLACQCLTYTFVK